MSSSKPGTPLTRRKNRYSHRSSGVYALLPQSPKIHYPIDPENLPLDSDGLTDNFEQLSDSVQDLELNMTHLHSIHQCISQGFNESFASFLYGLSVTAWCIEFPATPSKDLEEKLIMSKRIDENISVLQEKIDKAKRQNEALKLRLQSKMKAKQNTNVLKVKPLNQRPGRFGGKINDKINESTSNESTYALRSKIPSKYQNPYTKPVQRPPVTYESSGRPAGTPNLNQPPRYLDGLFNGSSSSNSSIRKRPAKTQGRPPFR